MEYLKQSTFHIAKEKPIKQDLSNEVSYWKWPNIER